MNPFYTVLHGYETVRSILFIGSIFFSEKGFSQNDNQTIAPELVGKWCYINMTTTNDAITSSCITLNDDGTFEASLDRSTLPRGIQFPAIQDNDYGKWWVVESRIFYKSSTNGQGNFFFEKVNHPRLDHTPMIVISGVSFATSSPRDPW
ncbi:MAG: hypothetical protein QM734_07420 [Cyclobacteriaceae bacterium]